MNYKAKAEALEAAAVHIENSFYSSHDVLFLSDALSVLQVIQSGNNTELNDLSSAFAYICQSHKFILQWIPTHCVVLGNNLSGVNTFSCTFFFANC